MQLAIHTYGHLDAMYYVLNGIAMIMNSKFATMLVEMITIVATAYYGLKMAYAGASHQYKQYIGKIAAMVIMTNALIIPKTDMIIIDHVTKKQEKVDNLPYGFAVPVGVLEAFGDMLTGGFEQAFTALGNTNYRDYGMVFGARLVQDARSWRIKTPEFVENMHTFLRRCVVRDAMIGYKYTAQDLLTTDDIWGLVSRDPNTLRQVAMRQDRNWELVTCKEAVSNYIIPAFTSEVQALKKTKSNSDFANANSNDRLTPRTSALINNMLEANINLAFGSYLGTNVSAENLIKQQMMINALSGIGDDYGYARASMQQESSWRIAGELAATYLPILLSVIKGLLYSSFIFMVPLMLLSGGGHKYLSYLTVVASLQLWPALNSVLNMFIDLYSSSTLSAIAGGIVSFTTYSQVGNYADKIVAVASGLQMSVPFLAFAIVQGGVGGFIHLASNITGASQSAATSVANEVTTGNRSIDNISLGNMQYAMQTGFKTDMNESYASGASSYQHMDGTMEKVVGTGQSLMQSGTGLTMSGGGVKYNLDSSAQNQLSQGLQTSESLLQSDQRSYSDAKSDTFGKTADYVSHLAQREHNGESFNYDAMGEHGKSLQQAVNHTKQLKQQYNYGWEQAAQGSLKASLSVDSPSFIKKLTGVSGTAGVEGMVNAINSSNQSLGEESSTSRDNHTNDSYNNIVKAASNSSWAKENSVDQSYSDGVRSSHERQQRLEAQVSARQEEVNSWHEAKTRLDSRGASSSQDMYDHVERTLVQSHGVSTKDAHKMIEDHDSRAERVWNNIVSQEVDGLMHEVKAGKHSVSGQAAIGELDAFSQRYEDRVGQNPEVHIKQHTKSNNLNIDEMSNDIKKTKHDLRNSYYETLGQNYEAQSAVRQYNEAEEGRLQQRADKYEEDRIGQGKFAKNVMEKLDWVAQGSIGNRIGGPDKEHTNYIPLINESHIRQGFASEQDANNITFDNDRAEAIKGYQTLVNDLNEGLGQDVDPNFAQHSASKPVDREAHKNAQNNLVKEEK